MVPICLFILAIASFFIPGFEPMTVLFGLATLYFLKSDKEVEETFSQCESVGIDMSGDRRQMKVEDFIFLILAALPFIVYFLGFG